MKENLRDYMDVLRTNIIMTAVVDSVYTPENNGNGNSKRHLIKTYTMERLTIFEKEGKPLDLSSIEGTKQYFDVRLSVYNGKISYTGSILSEEEAKNKLFGTKESKSTLGTLAPSLAKTKI